ncbi:gem-associated protein 8-like [Daphnia pulicaria]|uniref:gem-associated protein 8-like n=1 Tax=Daphnia pulicaria TaxID=35523 RepID=UPI001EEBC77F|nr:gem-associated protein 8-like [Daphnia pulicaria]
MAKDWTQDPRFNHYWKNYRHGLSWYSKHQISYYRSKMVSMDYENSFLHWFMQHQLQVETQPILTQDESASLPSLSKVNERKVPQNEEFEMEITGDMLEFLKKSMKHKKERDETNTTQEVKYINVDEIPIERVASDSQNNTSTNVLDEKHHESDYFHLYGADAPRIQAMETAVQLNFNRNCDRKQPKPWPNMPLHL